MDFDTKVFVVFGATGIQGGSVAKAILDDSIVAKQFRVRAISRDPAKPAATALAQQGAEVIKADMEDKGSLRMAMKDAHAVFAVTNLWETILAETRQGKNVADIAKELGVKHLIWSSLPNISQSIIICLWIQTGQAYTKNTNQWITLSGLYTATSSSDLFGVYISCAPYHVNTIFNAYLDNAKLVTTTTTQVCTTSIINPYSSAITIRHYFQCCYVICAYGFKLGCIISFKSAHHMQLSLYQPIIKPNANAISLIHNQYRHFLLCIIRLNAQATTTAIEVLTGSSGQSEPYTTSTIFSTHTATITACPSTVTNCPSSAKTTFITTETVLISTTICPITGSPFATGTANPENPFLSVSPVFSTRTATLTSCPSGVSDCPATEVVTQVTTETLLVGESMYTLPAATSTYSFQTLSPFSRPSPASGMSENAIPTSAEYHDSTAIISKTTLSSSSTPLPSTTQAAAPLFTGVGSFSHCTNWIQVLVSFAMAGLVLFCF
ncbi:hypothetical protein CDV55_107198 [Aspergillus turcosus]|uniref:NmrA-like domain-containing protein n=1 Tax=Aspergillus turcosus TaxID=1245748 RepID=A0A229YHI8_9EURO|nr:hypothetical protein CDV55_107198 [Aspergillus turcosus]RLL98419.1 hypothetical protein CFD26_107220 [Aspergillus turcosus]